MTSLFPGQWCRLRWCRRKAVIQGQRHQLQVKRHWPGSSSNTLREQKNTEDGKAQWKKENNRPHFDLNTFTFITLWAVVWVCATTCMCVWASHPCSRPHLQVEGRRWGDVSEAAQTSRAPLSAPRKTGWTGTCSQLGVLSAGGKKKGTNTICDFFFFSRVVCFLTEHTCYHRQYKCVLLLSDLHLGVHTAVDGRDTPGWASGDQSVSWRGKDSPLVLIEGLQWRILAWTLQLVSTRWWQEEEEREIGIMSGMSLFRFV